MTYRRLVTTAQTGLNSGAGGRDRTDNLRFTKAMSIVQMRSGSYVDSLPFSEYSSELYAGVHNSAPGLVSWLVSAPMFEVHRLIIVSMVIFTLKR